MTITAVSQSLTPHICEVGNTYPIGICTGMDPPMSGDAQTAGDHRHEEFLLK